MPHPSQGKLPTGTVTFLFSDIEGSTRLAQALGTAGYREVLERHQALMRAAFGAHGGTERGTEGDSFFVVFADARDAVAAAVDAQRALAAEPWPEGVGVRVRMGLHTGSGVAGGDDYVGLDVNRAARIAAAGHGGQVLLSDAVRALAEGNLPDGVGVRDLGSHHLKDLDRPERLFQLVVEGLRSDFPQPRTLDRRGGNLPQRLTSFIGRDRERDDVARLLEATRLVTITGPGGTGKTSLAVAVAANVTERFPDGVWFVPLESVADADLVPTAIAQALGLDREDPRPPEARVLDYIRDRRLLLVLDNFEHLLAAAIVVRRLLAEAPGVRALVASQAPLHIAGEHEYPLAPLPLPDRDTTPDRVAASPCVKLFIERAAAVRPDFGIDGSNATDLVAICNRLQGLPLAIELAAAQVRLLSPAAIAARLTTRLDALSTRGVDVPERQRTLHAAVAWSYDLLDDRARALLRRLSVFAGGAGLDQIEHVTAGLESVGDPFEALATLVDRSLVALVAGEADRYAPLDTIRVFAAERLASAGEEPDASRRHAEAFAAFVEAAEPHLYRANRRIWLHRIATEHDNIRAALDRMEAAGSIEVALRIAAAAWRFWQQAGHLAEAIPRIERLLAAAERAPTPIDPALMSRAEEAAGGMEYWQRMRETRDIRRHYERSLEFARASGDAAREAWATYNLSFAYDYVPASDHSVEPDRERASQLRSDALARFRALGDDRGAAYTLWSMAGSPTAITNPLPELREGLAEALVLFRKIGEAFGESWALLSLAMVEAESGDLDVASRLIVEAGRLFVRDGDLSGQMVIVDALAALAARFGDQRLSIRLEAAGEAARRATGTLTPPIPPLRDPIEAARRALPPEVLDHETEAGREIPLQELLATAVLPEQASIRDLFDFTARVRRADEAAGGQ